MAPTNLPVRPTTDMAKESLFNIIENHYDFEETEAMDWFRAAVLRSLPLTKISVV